MKSPFAKFALAIILSSLVIFQQSLLAQSLVTSSISPSVDGVAKDMLVVSCRGDNILKNVGPAVAVRCSQVDNNGPDQPGGKSWSCLYNLEGKTDSGQQKVAYNQAWVNESCTLMLEALAVNGASFCKCNADLHFADLKAGVTPPEDPNFNQQWDLYNSGQYGGTPDLDIKYLDVWPIAEAKGSGAIVAVLDTGVNITHPDLLSSIFYNHADPPGDSNADGYPGQRGVDDDQDGQIDEGPVYDDDENGFPDDYCGWNFISNNSNSFDDHGHGTAIAGIISAIPDNAVGVAGIVPGAKILPVKTLDSGGSAYLSELINSLNYVSILKAAGWPIAVANASWGSSHSCEPQLEDAIANLTSLGVTFVAAAGNGGSDQIGDNIDAFPFCPASLANPSLIAVASVNRVGGISPWSNYGLTTVDLAAPGQGILAYQNRYSATPISVNGTSFSAPEVSAAVAMLYSYNAKLKPEDYKTALTESVSPLSAFTSKVASGGMLNLADAWKKFTESNDASAPEAGPTPASTPTPTPVPSPTPTATLTPTPTATPTATPTGSPTATPQPTSTAAPNATPEEPSAPTNISLRQEGATLRVVLNSNVADWSVTLSCVAKKKQGATKKPKWKNVASGVSDAQGVLEIAAKSKWQKCRAITAGENSLELKSAILKVK